MSMLAVLILSLVLNLVLVRIIDVQGDKLITKSFMLDSKQQKIYKLEQELKELKAKQNKGKITLTVDVQEVTEKVLKKVNEEIKRIKAENKFL